MRLWHFVCLITFHQCYGWLAAFFLFGPNIQKMGQQVRMRMEKVDIESTENQFESKDKITKE